MVAVTRQGIGFEDAHAVPAGDQELVANPLAHAWAEQLPDAGAAQHPHRPGAGIPEVGVADQADPHGVRGPDAERRADHALVLDDPSTEDLPELTVRPLPDQMQVELAEGRPEGVRILLLPLAFVVAKANPVPGQVDDR